MRGVLAFVLLTAGSTALADEVRISHLSSDLVTLGSGVFCGTSGPPAGSTEIGFWNSYTLTDFWVSTDVRVRWIEFGIEQLSLPTRGEATLTVNLYLDEPRAEPVTGLPLLASAQITLGETLLDVVAVDVEASFPTDRALIVELSAPGFYDPAAEATGDIFIVGANEFGLTAETYVRSIPCGLVEPRLISDFGQPFGIVMTLVGETICQVDIDEDGDLTIFDFLAFQTLFDAGDPSADFDGDGLLTIFGLLFFQTEFDAGC